jgi:hypothetical protein
VIIDKDTRGRECHERQHTKKECLVQCP